MTYEIRPAEEPTHAVRRIARRELDRALEQAVDAKLDTHEAVHEARKHCKKIRALLRLVRPAVPGFYATGNTRFRDASRILSKLRDAQVHWEALGYLSEAGPPPPQGAEILSAALAARRDRVVAGPPSAREQLTRFAGELARARPAVDRWVVSAEGDRTVWAAGLELGYRRCRSRMRDALETRSDERLHEWRKRVKDHGYHMRLLARLAGGDHGAHAERVDRMAELLGRDHDLAGLRLLLLHDPELTRLPASPEAVRLVEASRESIQREAFRLGRACFSDKPKKLARRLELARAN